MKKFYNLDLREESEFDETSVITDSCIEDDEDDQVSIS
jgi:hypothetical protein